MVQLITPLLLPKWKRVMQESGRDSGGHLVVVLLPQLASTTCRSAACATSISRYGGRWMKSGTSLLEELPKTGSGDNHDQPEACPQGSRTDNNNSKRLQCLLSLQTSFHLSFKQDSTVQANGPDYSCNHTEFVCKLWVGLWYKATVLHIHKHATH